MSPMNPRLLRPTASGATHPEARDWATRVTANGGSAGSTTLAAVSKFCAAIDAAGIRDRFYRLNLFCGTGLNACLVPLYTAASGGATRVGTRDIDNNVGTFVGGDYAESTGLTGNGTNYLRVGVSPSDVDNGATGHLSVYYPRSGAAASGTEDAISSYNSGATQRYGFRLSTVGQSGVWGQNVSITDLSPTNGHYLLTRRSATDLSLFRNSVFVNALGSSTTNTGHSNEYYVFANNNNGTPASRWTSSLRGYSIGLQLTDGQITSFYTAMQAFQTALGRNV
jgi:hypothetical protein